MSSIVCGGVERGIGDAHARHADRHAHEIVAVEVEEFLAAIHDVLHRY